MSNANTSQLLVYSTLFSLVSIFVMHQASGATIVRSHIQRRDSRDVDAQNQRQLLARQEDYDDEDTFVTPRINDITNGIDGILQGILARSPDKLLAGSFEFIPKQVRVGLKGILSTIAGRPVAQTITTTKKPTAGKSKDGVTSNPENAELEAESEEETPDGND